jgi:hypothetical protein
MAGIPRVTRRRKAPRLGGHRGAEFRHIGAADRDEAGRAELLREIGRYRPCHLTQRPEAERRGLARDHAAQILVQDRHAAERAIGQVAVSLEPRRVEPCPDHGIQLRVDRLNPGDGSFCQLFGTHLTAAHKIGLCGGDQPYRLSHATNATRARHMARCCWTSPGPLAPGERIPGANSEPCGDPHALRHRRGRLRGGRRLAVYLPEMPEFWQNTHRRLQPGKKTVPGPFRPRRQSSCPEGGKCEVRTASRARPPPHH